MTARDAGREIREFVFDFLECALVLGLFLVALTVTTLEDLFDGLSEHERGEPSLGE